MKRVEDRFNCVLASQISFARIDTFVDAFVNPEKSGEFFCVLSKHVYQGASLKMFKLNHSLNVSFFLTLTSGREETGCNFYARAVICPGITADQAGVWNLFHKLELSFPGNFRSYALKGRP
jgi:hypothetical protein